MERAQLVWQRARELVDPMEQHDGFAVALELLRTAEHHPTVMTHALTLGQNHVRRHTDDVRARGGVRILERSIAFLGVKPTTGDAAAGRRTRQEAITGRAMVMAPPDARAKSPR